MTAPWNGRPPAPLDERDGWHWLHMADGRSVPRLWMGPLNFWARSGSDMSLGPLDAVKHGCTYGGAILTPDQIAAQIAEAVKAEREEIATICERMRLPHTMNVMPMTPTRHGYLLGVSDCAAAIRARGETQEP